MLQADVVAAFNGRTCLADGIRALGIANREQSIRVIFRLLGCDDLLPATAAVIG